MSYSRLAIFLVTFLIPLAAIAAYEELAASDRYGSDATAIVTAAAAAGQQADAPVAGRDLMLLTQFMTSAPLIEAVDGEIGLRDHYSGRSVDLLSRLPAKASREALQAYMQRYVTAAYDPDSQVVSLHVEAFSPAFAQKFAAAILAQSRDFTAALGEKIAGAQVQFYADELAASGQRLADARQKLAALKSQRQAGGAATNDPEEVALAAEVDSLGNAYRADEALLAAARLAAAQRQKYLVVVAAPSLAEASLYPNRGFVIGSAAAALFMFFFVVSLIVAIIREHA